MFDNSPENEREIQTFWCSQKRQAASTSLPRSILIKYSIKSSKNFPGKTSVQ